MRSAPTLFGRDARHGWFLLCLAWLAAPGTFSALAETTIYLGKHFEVWDHDQPTKYVFNGDTRLAHVMGSLSTNTRIQRLRLYPGWNRWPSLLRMLSAK